MIVPIQVPVVPRPSPFQAARRGPGGAIAAAAALLLAVPACEPAAELAADDRAGEIPLTAVTLGGDGTRTVRTSHLTSATLARMRARRAALARGAHGDGDTAVIAQAVITQDGGCADSSLWLFDAPGQGGEMLCLSRTGVESNFDALAFYTRTGGRTWDHAVRSFSSGSDGGYFETFSPRLVEPFEPNLDRDGVSDTVANASIVALAPFRAAITLNLTTADNPCPTTIPLSMLSVTDGSILPQSLFQIRGSAPGRCLYEAAVLFSWKYGMTYQVTASTAPSCFIARLFEGTLFGRSNPPTGFKEGNQIQLDTCR